MNNVKVSFLNQFPNGWVETNPTTIYFGLIGDIDDCANRIRNNDPMYSLMRVDREQFTAYLIAGSLSVNPPADSYLVMQSKRLPFRKIVAKNETELDSKIEKFFVKLRAFVDDNKSDIYNANKIEKYLV